MPRDKKRDLLLVVCAVTAERETVHHMKKSALRASYAGLAGVMFGLVLDLNPVGQMLLGLAAFVVAFGVFALLAR